ncbi:SGNH/GDSL hydrolase family protein [Methylobacterium planeticum]|uniref:SGNH/GDSL hydrolase family protein n=1 Tax=Methylobacterium planeticum TaxID=2615211 RepID=A0A6N6MFN4_9HYPH|nr:GDSL-type esterase/lipase family protein [Methylobacterium planeticum]KAB1069633.1 SGNH/GDSL hydrolase family protein [Methylobacterium planeticum]
MFTASSIRTRVKPLRSLLRGASLLVGLLVLPTAVLAYADLLPESFDLGTLWSDASPSELPHVAYQLAHGDSLRIVAFGSSSTEGIGASTPAAAYPPRLEAALKRALPQFAGQVTVLNRGIGGEHVDDMLRRLDRDVLAAKPHLVIWQTGSNDPLRGVPLEHFRSETTAAILRMREAGIDVVLMEPQWCPKLDATPGAYRFRDVVREIGDELELPVIRRSELMKDWIAEAKLTRKELFSADGLHMADAGYALLARAAADEILRDARPQTVATASAD